MTPLPLLTDVDGRVRLAAAGALVGQQDPAVTRALLPLLSDHNVNVRLAAAGALAGRQDPAVTQALLPLLRDSDLEVRFAAARALAGRSEQWLLIWVTKQGRLPQTAARRAVLFALADQIADRDYLRLPLGDMPRIRRGLGKLTRKAAPVPGQRRLTAAARLRAVARRAKTRLRRHPLRAAAASALAIIAGVVGGQLTGKPSLAVAVAFVVLLVAAAALTYQTEDGADPAGTEDAHRHPR